jgi:hypothetical protein
MRALFLIVALCSLAGCEFLNLDIHQTTSRESMERRCQSRCQKVYGTDLDYVGLFTGDCYCKESERKP